jgi:Beta-L-arabinofuranosidase, GH127 middle domain/Beta-L-arabinofuranosidase, GH127 catalytic domain
MVHSTRRSFLKILAGAAAASGANLSKIAGLTNSGEKPGLTDVVLNRSPLAENHFYPFPLTSIRPKGWLLNQLRIQANGLSGHLDEFWPDVGPQSGWLGGNGEAWERGPYFLDGLLPLAHLLQDDRLLEKSKRWIDWTLTHPAPSGMFGPTQNDDWWPRIVMLKVLTQHYEATGDSRVIEVMEAYFSYQLRALGSRPLSDWGKYRWQDEALSVVWLYNRTGNRKLLQVAELLHQQGYNWRKQFESFEFKQKTRLQDLGLANGKLPPDRAMQTHGVNNAMALKSSAIWWLFSHEADDRSGVDRQLVALDTYHGMPTGMFSADEHLAGRSPSQGVELCAVVEAMFSLEHVIAILGDASLGDRLEKITYNALPAALTHDMWAHQYDQQTNQIECTMAPRPWTTNGPESNLFGLEPNFGCCTANMHQGWPKFTSSLWMASAEGGIAAIAYAPCELKTRIAGVPVHIEEETEYPFDGRISFLMHAEKPTRFPLGFRIPRWAEAAKIALNDGPPKAVQAGSFTVLKREWKSGDRVTLELPMAARTQRWDDNSVVVERGPLLFSLPIETAWEKLRTRGMTADWEARPKSEWNYALEVNELNPRLAEMSSKSTTGESVLELGGAPIRVEVRGKKASQWKVENGVAGEMPPSKVSNSEPLEKLSLVPYSAAKLRITVFPVTGPSNASGAQRINEESF